MPCFSSSESDAKDHPEAEHIHASTETEWTCSMHPQVRQPEAGSCPICGMDLIPLESHDSSDPLVFEMTPEAVKLAQIETTVLAATGSAEKVLTLSGKIQADERLAASQVVHVPGRIEALYVSFTGERISKGQKLATIYSPEWITAQREFLEALKLKDTYPELLEAARTKIEAWKMPEELLQTLEEEEKIQETVDVYADVSGVVTGRKVAVGDYVKQGESLFEVVNLTRVWVLFDAYEEDLVNVRVGDKVAFTTAALPGQTFTTRITFIDPVINPQTRVASLRGEVRNFAGKLKPEMFVNGKLQARPSGSEQLLVPKSAVLWTGERSVVYVKVPDMPVPTFRYREVNLGERVGDSYQVHEGLDVGDEVVTYGSFTLDAAAQLNNKASMMNQWVKVEASSKTKGLDFTSSGPMAFQQRLNVLIDAYIPPERRPGTDSTQIGCRGRSGFFEAIGGDKHGIAGRRI